MQDLRKIITERIAMLEEKFKPEMIIVGSNTPTLLLGKLPGRNTIGVLPPLAKAASVTKTGGVAVVATHCLGAVLVLENTYAIQVVEKNLGCRYRKASDKPTGRNAMHL